MTGLRALALWLLVVLTATGSVEITLHTGVPAVWAAGGIAVCAMLTVSQRLVVQVAMLPLVLLCTAIGNILAGRPSPISAALAAADTAEVLAILLILSWRSNGPYRLASWTELRRTVAACAVGAGVFAGASAVVMATLDTGTDPAWVAWALGSHVAGTLVIVPLVAMRSPVTNRPRTPEVLFQVAVLALAVAAVFSRPFTGNAAFLLIPALLWAAARFPAAWASRQLAAVALAVVALTLAEVGPFVGHNPLHSGLSMTASVQSFLVVTALLTLAFSTSVAAERAAVARYHRQEAGMERMLESAEGTAFIATDVEGRITLFNSGAERLLGYDSSEVVGTATPMLFHLEEEVRLRAGPLHMEPGFPVVMAGPGGDDQCVEQQWTWVCKDGRHRVVSLSRAIVRDHWGRPTAYLAIARDVTESLEAEQALRSALSAERELNQRLRELDATKSDFVANVSHELRTPLATIIGATELLEDGIAGALTTRQGDLVDRINRNGVRLLRLIEDLLTLGAVSEGDFAISSSHVDLCDVVRQVIGELRKDDARRVCAELPSHPVAVGGDREQLVRLVENLVGNACKFTPSGGRIRVAVHAASDGVRLEVVDTGVGIAWEDQPLVFERFFRGRSTRESELPGTGLGLSIVRSIAEAHGAVAECVSTPGQGSTFSVRFPDRPAIALAG